MNTKDNSEIRELEAGELEKVSGTGVFMIPRANIGPAAPTASDGTSVTVPTSPTGGCATYCP
jgi:hypothetical protein